MDSMWNDIREDATAMREACFAYLEKSTASGDVKMKALSVIMLGHQEQTSEVQREIVCVQGGKSPALSTGFLRKFGAVNFDETPVREGPKIPATPPPAPQKAPKPESVVD